MINHAKNVGDAVAGMTVFGAVIHVLPEIAAVLAIIWTFIRIYEWARVRIFHIKQTEDPMPFE